MRTVIRILSALLAVGLLVGAVAAQQSDLLKDARQRQELEAQRVQKYVDEVIEYGNTLARQGRTAEAIKVIRTARDVVRNNTDLPEAKRDRMVSSLDGLEKKFDIELKTPVVRNLPVQRPMTDDQRKAAYDQATRTMSVRGVSLVDARNLNDEKASRYLGVMRDIDRASLPPIGDYEFPKDWAERSKRRLASANPMTDRERDLLKALNSPIEVEFKEERFQDVIKYLEKATGQPIVVDEAALKEANVTYEGSIVNYTKRRSAYRSVLKKVLGDLGLTYIVKDETIFVTTPARARDTMSIRTYYVGDLISTPSGNPYLMMQQVNQILVLIQQTIDPESWEVRGGAGSIYFEPVTMTFVVRQSAEVHFLMGVGLRR